MCVKYNLMCVKYNLIYIKLISLLSRAFKHDKIGILGTKKF